MTRWSILTEELDRWSAAGRNATFWWRDDDAADVTPPLERLLGLAVAKSVPLAIAVIPETAAQALADRLRALPPGITVLQHGYSHRDHSGPSRVDGPKRKKTELTGDRPIEDVCRELREGRAKLRDAFGDRFRDVLVPPWNRIDSKVLEQLPALGFEGLSTFGPLADQDSPSACAERLVQANSTIDIIRWRPERAFLGEDALLDQILSDLHRERAHSEVSAAPLGLMTHHLVHDEACWRFVSNLLEVTLAHRAARWLTADEVFAGTQDTRVPRRRRA